MKTFQVVTDSTSDLIKTYREQYDIDYIKMNFNINDVDYIADIEMLDISYTDYYGEMRKGNRSLTNAITAEAFTQVVEKYLQAGLDVLYVACSSKNSASVNLVKPVAAELEEKYGKKIICFDSYRNLMSEGMIAMKAAQMAEEGKSVDEVASFLDGEKTKYQTVATVGTLEWLRKAGRIKAAKAFFGNLFGVKPIIITDANGANFGFKKMKGRPAAIDELVAQVQERIIDKSIVYVEHADCLADAELFAEKLKGIGIEKVEISCVGPIIGATTGPDTLAASYYGKAVDLAAE